jgi:VanZ family protein
MRKNWLLVFLWTATIFTLSSIPNPPQPAVGNDFSFFILTTIEHIIEYGILGFLLFHGFTSLGKNRRNSIILAIILAALYGVTDEIHQYYVPNRVCDIKDAAADAVGGTIGAIAASLTAGLLKKQNSIKLKP